MFPFGISDRDPNLLMKSKVLESSVIPANLRLRFQKGFTWNVVSALFTQGSTLLANLIIANILGKEIFGEYGMIQSTILTLTGIAQVATGVTATKYVAEFRSTNKERTGRVLGLCSVVTLITGSLAAIILFSSAPWLANHALNAPYLAQELRIASGFVLFSVMNGYQVGTLAGLESYSVLARVGTLQGVLHVVLCALATWFWGLEGAIAGFVVSAAIRWFLFHQAIRNEGKKQSILPCYQGLMNERIIFLRFALPAAISGLSSMPALWLANALLVQQPGGYPQMALYSASYSLRSLVIFLPALLNNVGMSLLNNQRGLGDDRRYRKVFWTNLIVTLAAALTVALLIAATGRWLLGLFGKNFTEGYPVLIVLIISTVPETLAVSCYQIIQSQSKMWLSFFAIALPRDIALVIFTYITVPSYGAIGLALAYTISWVLALIIIISIVWRLGLNIHGKKMGVQEYSMI